MCTVDVDAIELNFQFDWRFTILFLREQPHLLGMKMWNTLKFTMRKVLYNVICMSIREYIIDFCSIIFEEMKQNEQYNNNDEYIYPVFPIIYTISLYLKIANNVLYILNGSKNKIRHGSEWLTKISNIETLSH